METKYFLLVCRVRETGSVYLSRRVFNELELQRHMCYLDSVGVDVIDFILVEVDLSKYQNLVEVNSFDNQTKSILVKPNLLQFLIEGRKDDNGHDYFILSVGLVKFKFCKIESVLDLLNSNSCGYVGK